MRMSFPESGTRALLPCPFYHYRLVSQAVAAETGGKPGMAARSPGAPGVSDAQALPVARPTVWFSSGNHLSFW